MRFKELRRRRRQPKPPMFLLDLQLPLEVVIADLSYPRAEPATEWAAVRRRVDRIA